MFSDNVLLGLFIFAAILFVISLVWLIVILRKPPKETKSPPARPAPAQAVPVDRSTRKVTAVNTTATDMPTSPGVAAASAVSAFLTLEDAAGKTYALDPLPVSIGRDPQKNKVVLNDVKVSMAHARVYYDKLLGSVCIEDTNSLNGVFVDEAPTLKNVLNNGAKVRLGETAFTFRDRGYIANNGQ
jgi:hypothetical protein